ncbi:Zinc finger MYM-type protein 1 [Merluccius polli]|uniref:Zinc finger MYM-type protein 1 n=1 Tax=Merluccius polli TaxID=89951 RepID=A0AA47MSZ6_MERPO|nr:Zinc finger MYM-type protein 1 [Merluccius polli]
MDLIDQEYKRKVEENRRYINTIAVVLLLTATQKQAQRGHRESEDSDNRGNFIETLTVIAKHDPTIGEKMRGKGNAKYTSSTIQNEILECLANMVRDAIVKEVKESEVFSVIADESKDLQKKEQLSLVDLDAKGLSVKIIQCLEKYGLNYKDNLIGQGYDGAAVMSGKHSGVAARIQSEAKQAFYVHCNAHCLNLVLVDTVKSVAEPRALCLGGEVQQHSIAAAGFSPSGEDPPPLLQLHFQRRYASGTDIQGCSPLALPLPLPLPLLHLISILSLVIKCHLRIQHHGQCWYVTCAPPGSTRLHPEHYGRRQWGKEWEN